MGIDGPNSHTTLSDKDSRWVVASQVGVNPVRGAFTMYAPASVVLDIHSIYGKNLLVNGVQARRNVQQPGTAQCLPLVNMMRDGGCLSQVR
jgi:hypothetical protein